MSDTFHRIKLDDLYLPLNQVISNLQFESVDVSNDDFTLTLYDYYIRLEGGKIGGKLSGHSHKPRLWDNEDFDFDFNLQKGAISYLMFDWDVGHNFVDNKIMPTVNVRNG